jgi:hypothetical protein
MVKKVLTQSTTIEKAAVKGGQTKHRKRIIEHLLTDLDNDKKSFSQD